MLDLLAGRKTTGSLQGRILFGGQPPSTAFLRRYTGRNSCWDAKISEHANHHVFARLPSPMARPAILDITKVERQTAKSCSSITLFEAWSELVWL